MKSSPLFFAERDTMKTGLRRRRARVEKKAGTRRKKGKKKGGEIIDASDASPCAFSFLMPSKICCVPLSISFSSWDAILSADGDYLVAGSSQRLGAEGQRAREPGEERKSTSSSKLAVERETPVVIVAFVVPGCRWSGTACPCAGPT